MPNQLRLQTTLRLAAVLFFGTASAASAQEYLWTMQDSYNDGKHMRVPDEKANADLILFGNAALSYPDSEDNRVLLLDGQVRTQAHFPYPGEIRGLRLKLLVRGESKPAGETHEYLATLTKVMRLTLNREGDLVFAVWNEEREPAVVKVPFPADGSWQEVEAVHSNGVHSLRVGERMEAVEVPSARRLFKNERGLFFFGANINNDNWTGAIDDVSLTLEPATP